LSGHTALDSDKITVFELAMVKSILPGFSVANKQVC